MSPPARAVALGLALCASVARAQDVADLDPPVRVEVRSPTAVTLRWDRAARPTVTVDAHVVYRRDAPDALWEEVAGLPADAARFDVDDLEPGRVREYRVERVLTEPRGEGNGYVLAGVDVPFDDDPGAALVVTDEVTASEARAELDRLLADLDADGWSASLAALPRGATPPDVRARIQAAHRASSGRLKAVFLVGAVPRAFSGVLRPDGHADHLGAWPADGYYADLDGAWTDAAVSGGTGAFANRPGDGRFDPSVYPSAPDVAVGRLDAEGMPAFGMSPAALVRRYLARDHAYRAGEYAPRLRAHVSDAFGYFRGEAFARGAWRDSAAILGAAPDTGRPFFDALEDPAGGYALAFGYGPGNPRGAAGVGSTSDFATRRPRAVLAALFGSYFGDWSYDDDFLRAALLGETGPLVSLWSARPYAHLHALGALRTVGEAWLATARNAGAPDDGYDGGSNLLAVHQALLGDPTLRLFVARPPSSLRASASPAGVALAWSPSPDAARGYHVYRRALPDGAYERLTASPVGATTFADGAAAPGARYRYRVVAVQRVTTGSGRFDTHSLGAVVEVDGVTPMPDAGAIPDASVAPDAALPSPGAEPGCSCRASPPSRGTTSLATLALALAAARRRRASHPRP